MEADGKMCSYHHYHAFHFQVKRPGSVSRSCRSYGRFMAERGQNLAVSRSNAKTIIFASAQMNVII